MTSLTLKKNCSEIKNITNVEQIDNTNNLTYYVNLYKINRYSNLTVLTEMMGHYKRYSKLQDEVDILDTKIVSLNGSREINILPNEQEIAYSEKQSAHLEGYLEALE